MAKPKPFDIEELKVLIEESRALQMDGDPPDAFTAAEWAKQGCPRRLFGVENGRAGQGLIVYECWKDFSVAHGRHEPVIRAGGWWATKTMSKFRKRPVVIEAEQFDPLAAQWPAGVIPWRDELPRPRDCSWGYIDTLEGKMHVIAGDWVITGVAGEKYPCKDRIFKATYEPVDD